ncbi:CDP-diacylglycerol---serine O-phosphatidyltransferase [Carpediemonas membranifera]|uniref:CDP-diacylglycerol---serine O-phosphatidyltransferase n=1 Tax=Carpediemonas membranifera TaxID=201153 RepID=A0A8J6BFK7_9EUKA|nr:CDP-diacylglycerol---serine O-phosphatidyltransferase [Carpediemonas membranifera]|eukprot:KAG9396432.1 CDP-diacylglycerol---serine O-phosphatidyltransferase [Carpediemonas membranifera]
MIGSLFISLFYIGKNNIPDDRIIRFTIIFVGTILSALIFSFLIPNCWYANCLSIMNMSCGLAGVYIMTAYEPGELLFQKEAVFLLIFIGQFFDLFDGRAAEQWGSTPKGEYFDDVADGTSFGFTIGVLIFVATNNRIMGLIGGTMHGVCTFYRLIRFIVEKHRAGQTGGALRFDGMPSPAAAIVMGSGSIILSRFGFVGDILIIALATLSSYLQVSWVVYPHLSRAFFAWVPRRMLMAWFVGGTIGGLFFTALRMVWVPVLFIHCISVAYMLTPYLSKVMWLRHPVIIRLLEIFWLRSKDGSRYLNKLEKESKE